MASSLRNKYLLLALSAVTAITCLLGGLAYLEHRTDAASISALANGTVAEQLESGLEARARTLSRVAAMRLAGPMKAQDAAATARVGRRLLKFADVASLQVLDDHGRVVFSGRGEAPAAGTRKPYTYESALLANPADASGARLGTLRLQMSRASLEQFLTSLRHELARQQALDARRVETGVLGLSLLLLALGTGGAALFAARLTQPISQLVKSAERIGQGDYTQPLPVLRHDEIGGLQAALEQMRQKLRET
ncbi:MAG: HAMP domain-containing protein, partial [Steroidobacteraceae bacterium]|nr:HAMP domain-containing protein [Steroidobacteraceae bacterium]